MPTFTARQLTKMKKDLRTLSAQGDAVSSMARRFETYLDDRKTSYLTYSRVAKYANRQNYTEHFNDTLNAFERVDRTLLRALDEE